MKFKFALYGTDYFVNVFNEKHLLTQSLKTFSNEQIIEILNDTYLFVQLAKTSLSEFTPDNSFSFTKRMNTHVLKFQRTEERQKFHSNN